MEIILPIAINYCAHWTKEDAVREILQNAIDGGLKEIGKDYITNEGVLEVRHFVLGNSDKVEGQLGKFGEGLKLALLVLARENIATHIWSGDKHYIPHLRYKEEWGTEVLCIEVQESESPRPYTTVCIDTPLNIDELYIEERGVLYNNPKLYVGGLFIRDISDTFKHGYSLDVGALELDRDRRQVDLGTMQYTIAWLWYDTKDWATLYSLLEDPDHADGRGLHVQPPKEFIAYIASLSGPAAPINTLAYGHRMLLQAAGRVAAPKSNASILVEKWYKQHAKHFTRRVQHKAINKLLELLP